MSEGQSISTSCYNVNDSKLVALARLNDEGCMLYRSGDYSGSLSLFLEGLRRHDQSFSKYSSSFHRSNGNSVEISSGTLENARHPERHKDDTLKPASASPARPSPTPTRQNNDIEFDEGMHAFADVLYFGNTSSNGRFPDSSAILAALLFNVGQAKRRDDAMNDVSDLYDSARCAIGASDQSTPSSSSSAWIATSSFSPPVAQPMIVPILHNIGQLQYQNGKIPEAIESFTEALHCARTIHGENNAAVAAALNSLGVIHYHCSSEDSNEAMVCFQEALKIEVEAFGHDNPEVATTLNNIGRAHVLKDKFDDALLCYEDALRIRGEKLGNDSVDYAASALNAGQILHQKGDYDKALHLYHKFLRIIIAKFTKNQHNVAEVLSSVAEIHGEKNEVDKALEFYEKSLESLKGAVGEFHPEVAFMMARIGNFQFEQGNLDAALKSFRDGLKIERRLLEPDHPNIITALTIVGELHKQRNEWDEAAKCYSEKLELQRSKLGVDHEDTASTLDMLGVIYRKKGDMSRSISYTQHAQSIRGEVNNASSGMHIDLTDSNEEISMAPHVSAKPTSSFHEFRSDGTKRTETDDESVSILRNNSISLDSLDANGGEANKLTMEIPTPIGRPRRKENASSADNLTSLHPPMYSSFPQESDDIVMNDKSIFIDDRSNHSIGFEDDTAQEIESIAMETFPHGKSTCGSLGTFTFMAESIEQDQEVSSIVYESLSTRIYRIQDIQNTYSGSSNFVAVKMLTDQFPDPDLISSLENEYKILQRLSHCDVSRSVFKEQQQDGSYALYLEWVEGITLKEWIRMAHGGDDQVDNHVSFGDSKVGNTFSYASAIVLAKEIAVALDKIHASNVVHNDITTENIIVDTSKDDGSFSVKIIDFGLATVLDEQDHVTGCKQNDLISLGAVFFEIFMGETLPENMIHTEYKDGKEKRTCVLNQHGTCISRSSNSDLLSRFRSKVPSCISSIVFDLINKKGDNYHYQSTGDVATDFMMILSNHGHLLGNVDREHKMCPFNFQIGKVYGRNEHISVIMDAYKRINQPDHSFEMVMVSGYSGSGKSALVQQVQKPIKDMGGVFLSGKYDHFRQMEPLSAIIAAFTEFCNDAAANTEQLPEIRARIEEMVGSEITTLANVLPSLHQIIELPSTAVAQNELKKAYHKIKFAFRLFVRAISTPDQPLVLFLDDLQWADSFSLDLIEYLATDAETKSSLLIGSYRDNEVTESHQLAVQLRSIESKNVPVILIKLGNLNKEDVNELISDVIQVPPPLTHPLANAVHRKTSGNVLFVLEFLRSLYDEGLLYFSWQSNQWQWDTSMVEAKSTVTSAVDLMAHKIKFGCTDLMSSLELSIEEGLLDYTGSAYHFAHDQIQLAAYSLISVNDRGKFHLWIGSQVWANEAKVPEKALFIAVGQMNKGATLISDTHQRAQLVELNYQAGRKSMSLGAFQPAAFYLENGIALLNRSSWVDLYDLCLQLYGLYAEAKYCVGDFEKMNEILDVIFTNAKNLDDKLSAYFTLVAALNAQGKSQECLTVGLDVLSSLGNPIPAHSDMKAFGMAEFQIAKRMINMKTNNEILALKTMDDIRMIATMRLMYGLTVSSFFARQEVFLFLISQMVQISLRDGICNESAFAFASFGVFLTNADILLEIETACRMGKLALRLLEISQGKEYLPGIYFAVYFFIQTCVDHYRTSLEPLKHAYSVGMRCGELNYAAAAARQICALSFHCGEKLEAVEQKIQYYGEKIKDHKQDVYWRMILPYRQAIYCLTGGSGSSHGIILDNTEEENLLTDARKNNTVLIGVISYIRGWLAYLFRKKKLAASIVEERKQCQNFGPPMLFLRPALLYVEGLISFETAHETDDLKWKLIAQYSLDEMKLYANHAPSNYKHKYLLLQAESAFLSGQNDDAARLYDNAISTADENGFIQDQAVAYERAGIFHFEQGNTSVASRYYGQAHDAYLKWGAQKKADELRAQCPF